MRGVATRGPKCSEICNHSLSPFTSRVVNGSTLGARQLFRFTKGKTGINTL